MTLVFWSFLVISAAKRDARLQARSSERPGQRSAGSRATGPGTLWLLVSWRLCRSSVSFYESKPHVCSAFMAATG